MSTSLKLPVHSFDGSEVSSVNKIELPEAIFDAPTNVALLHQVVTAQLAAARQGTSAVKNRTAVSGGGKKPYRQKGTGRARQGSTRSPQFAGGAVAHGPVPRSYAQRTPKKMIAAALRGALSDRVRNDSLIVVDELVAGQVPSTKKARLFIEKLTPRRKVLLVLNREEVTSARSAANLPHVHILTVDQLNAYDVIGADTVIFALPALHAFIESHTAKFENAQQKVGA